MTAAPDGAADVENTCKVLTANAIASHRNRVIVLRQVSHVSACNAHRGARPDSLPIAVPIEGLEVHVGGR